MVRSVLLVLVMTIALASAAFAPGPRGRSSRQSRRVLSLMAASDATPAAKAPKKAKKASKKAAAKAAAPVAVAAPAAAVKKVKAPAPETFKKADFVTSLSERTGLNKKEAEEAMQAVLDVIQEQVGAGKKVNLAGFGTFTLKERAARKGRNPQTGAELQIAASKAPGFSAAKAWKDTLNGK
jgi:DNA-binding protein HU-beta